MLTWLRYPLRLALVLGFATMGASCAVGFALHPHLPAGYREPRGSYAVAACLSMLVALVPIPSMALRERQRRLAIRRGESVAPAGVRFFRVPFGGWPDNIMVALLKKLTGLRVVGVHYEYPMPGGGVGHGSGVVVTRETDDEVLRSKLRIYYLPERPDRSFPEPEGG